MAFNVSGLTNRQSKLIILTRKEEIIKLLFHELIHYVGLDAVLVGKTYQVKWNIKNRMVNISEAYTEFVSIIMYCMFVSIHLKPVVKMDLLRLLNELLSTEIQYSVKLSANILKLYGYSFDTYQKFFKTVDGSPKSSPICTWEYVFLRTVLFLGLDQFSDIETFKLNNKTKDIALSILRNDTELIEQLKVYMSDTQLPANIAYTSIELDWDTI